MTGSWRPVSTVTSLQRLEDGGQNVLIDYGHGDIVNRSVNSHYPSQTMAKDIFYGLIGVKKTV